jgi:hypothetical protein
MPHPVKSSISHDLFHVAEKMSGPMTRSLHPTKGAPGMRGTRKASGAGIKKMQFCNRVNSFSLKSPAIKKIMVVSKKTLC